MTFHSPSIALACIGFLFASTSAAQEDFAAPWLGYDTSVYPSSISSWGVRQADFNGDGAIDLAVSGWYANPALSILFGDGHGRFAAPVQYPVVLAGFELEVLDVDLDGDVDIAVASTGQTWGGSTFELFKNQGNGTFASAGLFACGQGPNGVTTGDFNGDGWPDLAFAHDRYISSASSFAVVLNNHAGGFNSPQVFGTASGTNRIAAGDLDGDGDVDLALGMENTHRMIVCKNLGNAQFDSGTIYSGLPSTWIAQEPCIKVIDIDLDGDLDVLYSDIGVGVSGSGAVALFRNPGNGVFPAAEILQLGAGTQGACGIDVADVTGDGVLDVMATTGTTHIWSLLRGTGSGTFAAAEMFRAGEVPTGILAPDLDGDGDRDVVVIGRDSLEACVYLNPGGGAFVQPPTIDLSDPAQSPSSFSDLAVGDIDGDGDLDLAVGWQANFGSGIWISVRRNQGDGSYAPRENYAVSVLALALELADINGDGRPDLVWLDEDFPARVRWKLNNGTGTFGATITYSAGAFCADESDLGLFDFNGDGRLDLAVFDCLSEVTVALNNGAGGFGAPQVCAFSNDVSAGTAGDFNGDGKLDLVANSGVQGYVEVALGNGNGTFGTAVTYAGGRAVRAVKAADLDGDGILDLATAYGLDGNGFAFLKGRGDGTFLPGVSYPGSYSVTWDNVDSIAIGDVDRDLDLDVVIANYGSQDVSLWKNRGDGTFDPQIRLGVGNQGRDVHFGDFTGDGVGDLMVEVAPVSAATSWYYPAAVLLRGELGQSGTTYCTAKINSIGCTPSIGALGFASASALSGFTVHGANVRNNKNGLLFYGTSGPSALPFQGGTLCVKTPLRRTGAVSSGGTPAPANDCSGVYLLDMNAFAHSSGPPTPLPALTVPGTKVNCQWWGRDPGFAAPNNTTLTDALEYTVGPR